MAGIQDARATPHRGTDSRKSSEDMPVVYTGLHKGAPIPTAVHALRVAQTQSMEAQDRWSEVLGSLPSGAGAPQFMAELASQAAAEA